MSETEASRAAEIEAQAASFLERQVSGDLSDETRLELDRWLSESWSNRTAYLRLNAAWSRTDRLAALRRPTNEIEEPAVERRLPLFLKFAAAIAAFAILGVGAGFYWTQPQDRTFVTPVGGHETVAFNDGTRVELSTDTVLRTRMTTRERTIWLERGEAFFQVKHDATHPFVVIAGNHRVTDLGTKFLVRRDPSRLEVALLEGRVRFEAPRSPSQSVLLSPGEVVTATTSTMFITRESSKALAGELAWRKGALVFDNMSLADAAAEFNRYNQRKLIISDPAVAALTIVGKFRTSDVEPFARVIHNVLGLRIEAKGNDIVISR